MSESFSFEIEKEIAVLSERDKRGMRLELNYVSFGEYKPKYDIRKWDETHEKMGKGISLSKDELKALVEAGQGEVG